MKEKPSRPITVLKDGLAIGLGFSRIRPNRGEDPKVRELSEREDLFIRVFSSPLFADLVRQSVLESVGETNLEKVFPVWTPRNGNPVLTNVKPDFGPLFNNTRKVGTAARALLESREFRRGIPCYAFVIVRRSKDGEGKMTPRNQDIEQLSTLVNGAINYRDTILVLVRLSEVHGSLEFLFIKEKKKLKDSLDPRNRREQVASWFSRPLTDERANVELRKMRDYYWFEKLLIDRGKPFFDPLFTEERLTKLLKFA